MEKSHKQFLNAFALAIAILLSPTLFLTKMNGLPEIIVSATR